MDTQKFTFGNLSFTVNNPKGLFFMSDNLKQQIANMPIEEAKKANKAAWKQRKAYESIMSRYGNCTAYPGAWNDAAGPCSVCVAVCKETWKRIK